MTVASVEKRFLKFKLWRNYLSLTITEEVDYMNREEVG
jgi:hypothetical protein